MSDTTRSRLKVSREGLALIKSFEGFRPRAVRGADGRWTIGYGHTASAREGLTVGERDAELLLQYDLLPVVKALNEQVDQPLNQHQFDALASFAVSVGVERFLASDVLQRLKAGRAREAADALFGWPEPPTPETALRRRAAERALFVADPAAPIDLADLLTAPLSLPHGVHLHGTEAAAVAGANEPLDPFPGLAPQAPQEAPFAPADEPLVRAGAGETDPAGPDGAPPAEETGGADEAPPAPVLRHASEPATPRRSGWGEIGAFSIMGLIGLAACAASAASFRKGMVDAAYSGDFMLIGGVLAVIGLICVGVSAWNLYGRWGRRD